MTPLAEHLAKEAGPLLVVTGAGVSIASGLPVFRGTAPGAVWNRRVITRGTLRYFWQETTESWQWYLSRFDAIDAVSPTPAHHALAALERWQRARHGDYLLVTQNIDGLHQAAGSTAIIRVHGTAKRLRCASARCENAAPRGSVKRTEEQFARFRKSPTLEHVPRCPECGELLRPHILWFDERYDGHADYRIDEVLRMAKRARTILFAGTSFSVGMTASVLRTGLQRGAALYTIDPSGRSPHPNVQIIQQGAEMALPALVEALRS